MVYQQPVNVNGNVGALSNALAVAIQQVTSSQSGDGVNQSPQARQPSAATAVDLALHQLHLASCSAY